MDLKKKLDQKMSSLKKTYDTRKLHAEINKTINHFSFHSEKRKNTYHFKKMLLMQKQNIKNANQKITHK